jgi:hypothetical protein
MDAGGVVESENCDARTMAGCTISGMHCPGARPMGERKREDTIGYFGIKTLLLESYFTGCRDLGTKHGWEHEAVTVYAIDAFEESFKTDVENLMYHVVSIVMCGGWIKKQEHYHRDQARALMNRMDIAAETSHMPKQEIEDLLFDIKLIELK